MRAGKGPTVMVLWTMQSGMDEDGKRVLLNAASTLAVPALLPGTSLPAPDRSRGPSRRSRECDPMGRAATARRGMLGMGRIEATSLAHDRSVRGTNPAAAREHSHLCDPITNWCLALVRGQDSARLSSASTALAGAGATCGCHAFASISTLGDTVVKNRGSKVSVGHTSVI